MKCIVVELTDGSIEAYAYPDDESAAAWFGECRTEWNAGRNLIFYLRPGYAGSYVMRHGDSVAHLELASLDDVKTRGVDFREAIIFG